jgi:hypothetical protein
LGAEAWDRDAFTSLTLLAEMLQASALASLTRETPWLKQAAAI